MFAYAVSLMVYQIGSVFTGGLNAVGLLCALLVLAFIIFMLVKPYKEASKLTEKIRV